MQNLLMVLCLTLQITKMEQSKYKFYLKKWAVDLGMVLAL